MFSSVFDNTARTNPEQNQRNQSPFASSYARTATPPRNSRLQYNPRRALRYADEEDLENDSQNDVDSTDEASQQEIDDEDTHEENTPLLPIFDSVHLDTLPIYTLTHTLRLLVESRCETVLTWEQLRSPQVSQFLLKPIQHEIRTHHFHAGTIYCLMANCLQFMKETTTFPANSGTNSTRAMICELIAIKLLREYTSRGLIDALSYDFDPLQGQADLQVPYVNSHRPSWQSTGRRLQPKSVRISCMEIAIRAEAKRFLAHPVVVQQLEAIWDGSIVFHASADSMHRLSIRSRHNNYGTSQLSSQGTLTEAKGHIYTGTRKIVTLYNPREASLFKLSRLRVPRYRNILSTFSFAILLALFVSVLSQRSLHITGLEIFFWIWAGAFMMDEIVGFTEQGFGLYLASFWNTMDLGILLILFVHLCMRIYGIVVPDINKRRVANTAFDVLAADAILLFPRLFSVLDHYRYFSQLIIAFRLMTADLIAVFVLIVIACSGFFVALTLSFGYDGKDNASEVAYALFQLIMGFTPAVWDRWAMYTPLGRAILALFLTLCHFLVLTILITVLTNSFMTVVKNANEEHQFIFAINTISSVKSDALFSYVAPFNVLQWVLNPARYLLPFRQYVRLNRTVIKVTHFPILLSIFVYERIVLQPTVVDSMDSIENQRRTHATNIGRHPRLARVPSIATFRQDQALEEVFRQPLDVTSRTEPQRGRNPRTFVNKWMHDMGEDDASPPEEDDPKTVGGLERARMGERSLSAFSRVRRDSGRAQSAASDPVDLTSRADFFPREPPTTPAGIVTPSVVELDTQEDTDDGDDEMMTNDNDDDRMTTDTRDLDSTKPLSAMDYFTYGPSSHTRTPVTGSVGSNSRSSRGSRGSRGHYGRSSSGRGLPDGTMARQQPPSYLRNVSSATMIFNPSAHNKDNEHLRPQTALQPGSPASGSKPTSSGNKTPKPKPPVQLSPSHSAKDHTVFRSTPDLKRLAHPPISSSPSRDQRRTSLELDLVSDIGDNKAIGGGYVGAIPASFATQMAYASGGLHQRQHETRGEQERLGRLMMARMNTLEEGFRDVIHEMRENLKGGSISKSPDRPVAARRERRAANRETKGKKRGESYSGSIGKGNDSGSSTVLDPTASVLTIIPEKTVAAKRSREEVAGQYHISQAAGSREANSSDA